MKAIVTFGRMNPMTIGHQLLIDKLVSEGKKMGAKPLLFLSKTQDKKKNPLEYSVKVKYAKKFFPEVTVIDDPKVKTPINVLTWLGENGYTDVTLVVGSDRVEGFKAFEKYNGKDFTLESYKVVSAGERDPDADDATGMSASKMRGFIKVDDFVSFRKGLPKKSSETDAENLYKIMSASMHEDLDETFTKLLGEDYV